MEGPIAPDALVALLEVLSSNSSNHIVAHNHLQWDLMPSSGVSEGSNTVLTYINKSFLKNLWGFSPASQDAGVSVPG